MEDIELSNVIKSTATHHRAPQFLRLQLSNALNAVPTAPAPVPRNWGAALSNWFGGTRELAGGASFAFGAVLAFGVAMAVGVGSGPAWLSPSGAQSASASALTSEIVASHMRSLMASHLMDVVSTDQHTVKPWFNGKVDFSPPVNDLASQGYPLIGGRLDYVNGRTVAALVYRHDAHAINVFVWPEIGANLTGIAVSEQGYQISQWRRDGMRFAAVSDLTADELKSFAVALGQPQNE
jgi:anti-sigma factor RsiW